MAAAIKEGEKWAAGATEQAIKHLATTNPGISKILEYAFALKKQSYAETTIEGRVKILKRLLNLGADLYNTESVKEAIAKKQLQRSQERVDG